MLQNKSELLFTILHTNDEHSALIPFGPAIDYQPHKKNISIGGFARLASFVKKVRAEKKATGEPFILVSSGDIIGSNPYSWLIYRGHAPELNIMNKIGYDFITVGNHELHQEMEILSDYYKAAGYPAHDLSAKILGTNLYFAEDSLLAKMNIINRTVIKKLENGLTLGFMGLLGYDSIECTEQTLQTDFYFDDPIKAARKAVAELQSQNADIIIAVNHAGPEVNKKIARKVSDINVIIGGHEHIVIEEPIIEKGTIIVEAGESLTHAGVLEFSYSREKKLLKLRNEESGRNYLTPLNFEVKSDKEIGKDVSLYTKYLDELLKELSGGKIESIIKPILAMDYDLPYTPRREDHPAGNFATDAMRLMATEKTGKKVHVAFQGTGLFRRDLLRGRSNEAEGKVSFFDLAEVMEITLGPDGEAGTPMVSFYLNSKELRYLCEICVFAGEAMTEHYSLQMSGIRFEYDPGSVALFRIPPNNFPIPSFSSVLKASLYKGEERQTDNLNDYLPLDKKDNSLYHVVTDYLIAKHAISYINQKVPFINIVLRDKDGNPLKDTESGIIKSDGKDYKIWQALYDYASSFPKDETGLPKLDDYYRRGRKRIIPVAGGKKTTSKWPYLLISLLPLFIKLLKKIKNPQNQDFAGKDN